MSTDTDTDTGADWRLHDLAELDKTKQQLQEQHPGWQIWYVPVYKGGVTWCARPWPLINAGTVEQLEAEISNAHTEAEADWPALRPTSDPA